MKKSLSSITIRRPVTTIMIVLMVVVLGIVSIVDVPKDLMPDVELPVAICYTSYTNASPEEVESIVTSTMESALASVEGLDQMISYSLEGSSIVLMSFATDTDMNFATLDMREKIAMVEDYLPDTCSKPMVMKMDMNSMPVMQIYASADMPLVQLSSTVEDNLVPYFERSSGVASVSVTGGLDEEIAVEFTQENLANYGLSLSTISQLLAAENVNLPSGEISKGDTKLIVRSTGKFSSVEELSQMPLMVGDGSTVRLSDIGSVTRRTKEAEGVTRMDGKTAVGIMVTKASDANTVQVSKKLNKVLKQVQEKYPDINLTVGYDGADYINGSISNVASAAITGALLAVIVVFLFLCNIKSTLVIGISIPVSILTTFAAMNALGITLNIVTLCALTICVGMIVDNSIVVLENIYRVRTDYDTPEEAADEGTKEVLLSVMASTITTLVIFIPIAVSDGYAGLMFKDFCYTMIISLTASLVVAVTVVPMLCSRLMKGSMPTTYLRIGNRRYKYKLVTRFVKKIEELTEFYERIVRKALAHKKKFLWGCVAVFLCSCILLVTVTWELLPSADEGSISISVSVPYGTSLATKDEIMSEIEDRVMTIPELDHVAMSTEGISAMSLSDSASLTLSLCSRDDRKKSTNDISKELEELLSDISGCEISVASSDSIMSMFGSTDISVMIYGKDLDTLKEFGYEVTDGLKTLSCVSDAELNVSEGNPEVQVKINRNTASFYGLTAYQLASGLQTALDGSTATKLTIDGDQINVNLSLSDYYGESVENMKQITLTGNYGSSVPLAQIAEFEYDNAPGYIGHNNQQKHMTISVEVNESLNKAQTKVKNYLNSIAYPDGYSYELSGLADSMMDSFTSLLKALLVAMALVFLVLAAQFESALMAFIVMMSIPFAMTGAFIALFLCKSSLCMTSFLGLILLVGTVVNNAILLVEFANQNKEEMGTHEALVTAGKLRMRPILMTTLTTVVGMIPLALGLGQGGEMLAPMAISIIGGLTASTALSLLIIPCFYEIVDTRKERKSREKEERMAKIKALEEKWAEEDGKEQVV